MSDDKGQNLGFNKVLNRERLSLIIETISTSGLATTNCLEIGAGEGQMTTSLAKICDSVVAIDTDKEMLDKIPHMDNITTLNTKIEDFTATYKFDIIICTNFLEHTDNDDVVINKIYSLGNENTIFIFTTPNGHSFNRLIGVELGMLDTPTSLHSGDINAGHKRIYDKNLFVDKLSRVFDLFSCGTMFYKPFPNHIMEKLPEEVIYVCLKMFPTDGGAEIFAICNKKKQPVVGGNNGQ